MWNAILLLSNILDDDVCKFTLPEKGSAALQILVWELDQMYASHPYISINARAVPTENTHHR